MGISTAPAPAARRPAPPGARLAVATSWAVTALVSALPAIVCVELWGTVPEWLWIVQIGVALGAVVAGVLWVALAALVRFGSAMAVLVALLHVLPMVDLSWMPLQSIFGATAFDDRMQGEQTAKLIATAIMIGVLFALGYRRREMFLTPGRLSAPIAPVRWLGFPRADTWRRFGLVWGFAIAGALTLAQYLIVRPEASALVAIVPMLPSIVFYAALNAFNEEMTYRAPMLTTLEPAVGSTHALWQAAALFGVAHYFGTPGGLVGAALSVFMGWILSKAMVETRGLFWAWWIHFLSDISIFVFVALALVA